MKDNCAPRSHTNLRSEGSHVPRLYRAFLKPAALRNQPLLWLVGALVLSVFLAGPAQARRYELEKGKGVGVCNYVVKKFDNGSLEKAFLKQRFVKNGLFRFETKELMPNAGFNALLVEQAQGTLFNVYIETAPSSLSQEILEFLNTVEFIEYQKGLFVLANITPKKLDSRSVVYVVHEASFNPVCKFR